MQFPRISFPLSSNSHVLTSCVVYKTHDLLTYDHRKTIIHIEKKFRPYTNKLIHLNDES